MHIINKSDVLIQPELLHSYQNKIIFASVVIIIAIIVGSILGEKALSCHEQIGRNWESIHFNRAIYNNCSNVALHAENVQLIAKGWGYFGGVMASTALGFGALALGGHAFVCRNKVKTQLEMRGHMDQSTGL